MKNINTLAAISLIMLPLSGNAAITTFEYQGHGYAVFYGGEAADWTDANAAAVSANSLPEISADWDDSHLVIIEDVNENAAIFDALSVLGIGTTAPDGGGGVYAWVGANDVASEGDFEWVDGTDFWVGGEFGNAVSGQYNNWGGFDFGGGFVTFEPDDFEGRQDYVALSLNGWPNGSAGQWNDVDGGNSLAFVVEFDVVPEPSSALLLSLGGFFGVFARRRR